VTSRELLQRARLAADPKRSVSLAELERWLSELADAGILARAGDDWRPTPLGRCWLAPVAEAFTSDEAAVA